MTYYVYRDLAMADPNGHRRTTYVSKASSAVTSWRIQIHPDRGRAKCWVENKPLLVGNGDTQPVARDACWKFSRMYTACENIAALHCARTGIKQMFAVCRINKCM